MEISLDKCEFNSNGFEVVDIIDIQKLTIFKEELSNFLAKKLSIDTSGRSADDILNNIHKLAPILSDSDANNLVLSVINDFSIEYSFGDFIYQLLHHFISHTIGPDIQVQKNNNIVFQYPHSLRFSELHTDTPPNSPFELVTWLPLVDCYSTKSFYLLDFEQSQSLFKAYKANKFDSWDTFKTECLRHAIDVNVPYGKALVFWSGLIHGSHINTTSESRWCLNSRYKSLFAPTAKHDPLVYYKPLRISALSQFALSLYD